MCIKRSIRKLGNEVVTKRIVLFLFLMLAVLCSSASKGATQWIPLGTGDPDSYFYYDGVPFDLEDGEGLSVEHRSELLHEPIDILDFAFIGNPTTSRIHVLQACFYATSAPDGAVVGQLIARYMDGTQDSSDLIIGVNTAEWAYDRPENQSYLNHTKIPPAYSYEPTIDSAYSYQGHNFYLSLDTNPKPLASLDLVLNPASYLDYGLFGMEWFGIGVNAITLEVDEIPSMGIEDVLEFIDDSVEAGDLEGSGPGNSANGRLNALINMIETAGDLIADGLYEEAYQQLEDAYKKCDGQSPPPDFVEGDAAAELAEMILSLMEIL